MLPCYLPFLFLTWFPHCCRCRLLPISLQLPRRTSIAISKRVALLAAWLYFKTPLFARLQSPDLTQFRLEPGLSAPYAAFCVLLA